jgi:hypothetical protein
MALDGIAADLLSDEERAAISDGLDESEIDALKAVAGDDGEGVEDDPGGDEDGDSDDGDQDDGGEEEGNGQEAEAEEASAAPSDNDEPRRKGGYRAALPEGFAEQVAGIEAEQEVLADQFKAGDIDFDEYRASEAALYTRRDALSATRLKAEISAEMEQQSAEQQWQDAVNTLVGRVAAEDKIDYRKDAEKQRDLDAFVKVLAGDEKNATKPMRWFLDEAHKRVKALHGVASAPLVTPPAKLSGSRRPNLSAVPKTLAHVPGGDGPGDIGDEFSGIDGLEGLELESAIAKMSPAQREKFARA